MLYLVTGLPGNGKTLWTINHVEALRKESGRQVWYHGIPDLTLPWHKLESPQNWAQCPVGSIIVIDECQDLFPNRRQGSQVPEYVEAVTRHRHSGFDIFLLTQDAMNIDVFVRRLVGRHYFLKRRFGSENSRLYQWQGLGNPNDYHSKKEALKSWFKFPKEVFQWYRSAEVHTVKKDLPYGKLAGIVGLFFLCGFLFYRAFTGLKGINEEQVAANDSEESHEGIDVWGGPGLQGMASASGRPAIWTEASIKPRVAGVAASAPIFDSVAVVNEAPKIAGCGAIKIGSYTKCECRSQQGTKIEMGKAECLAALENGVFEWQGKAPRYPVIPAYVPPLPGVGMGGAEVDGRGAEAPASTLPPGSNPQIGS